MWPEPPTGPPALPPFTAWGVRAASAEALAAFRTGGLVTLPASLEAPQATPKQRRQAQRLRTACVGECVVVPIDENLLCGRLRGPAVTRLVAGGEHLTRSAAFDRTVPRTALRRPYQLQDPQLLFALRSEDVVRGTAGEPVADR